jgi:hypothetical protein
MAKFNEKWTPELQDYASQQEQKYGLPSGSLHQIIKQESAGYTDAISKTGARGLTQLMPGTAKEMGVTDINDPYQQISGGAKYYSTLLNGPAEGNPVIAAGMYNSGPNRKAYKIKDTRLLPTETQNYMKKFNSEYYANQSSPSVGEKVLNAVIQPASANEIPYNDGKSYNADTNISSSNEITPEQFASLKPSTVIENSTEITPEQFASLKPIQQERTLGQAISEIPANIIPSAQKNVEGIINAALHPVETAKTLGGIAQGTGQFIAENLKDKSLKDILLPSAITGSKNVYKTNTTPEFSNFATQMAERYGNNQNILNTLATDPFGLAMDISPVVSPAAKVAGLGKTAAVSEAVSKPVGTMAQGVTNIAGGVAKPILGVSTGAGSASIGAAYEAGRKGILSPENKAFRESLAGNIPETAVVDTAKGALQNIRNDMQSTYTNAISSLEGSSDIIPFSELKPGIDEALKIGEYKGKVTNPSVVPVKKQITDAVTEWENANPAEFHTILGLDALKKRVGDIYNSTELHTPQRAYAGKVLNTISSKLKSVSPEYGKIMEDYSTSLQQIDEIDRELSMSAKNPSTTLKKLQSVMRNNANTSWARRGQLADILKESGAPNLEYSLAGQNLNTWTPRGLAGPMALPSASTIGTMSGLIPAVGSLLASSPKLVGNVANVAGMGAKAIEKGSNIYGKAVTGQGLPIRSELLQTNEEEMRKRGLLGN